MVKNHKKTDKQKKAAWENISNLTDLSYPILLP